MKRDSTAIIARRNVRPGPDYYPTPPWATHALMRWGQNRVNTIFDPMHETVWEPAAGGGHMAQVLRDFKFTVTESDLMDPEDRGIETVDFLKTRRPSEYDWIITNPPFSLALEFALHSIENHMPHRGVCLLARIQLLETIKRWQRLWSKHQPTYVLPFVHRLSFTPGAIDLTPEARKASCHAWFVWHTGQHQPHGGGTRIEWLPDVPRDF